MSLIRGAILALLIFPFDLVLCSRILAIFPIPFRDHQIIFRPLIEELSKRGHQLTVLTTDPFSFAYDHVEIVDLSFAHNLKVLDKLKEQTGSGLDMIRNVFHVMRNVAEAELKSGQVQQLLRNDSEAFDVVLVDWSGPSLMNGFAYKFKTPLIGITPGGALATSHEAMGNPNHPVAFPSILMPFTENLNLFQRMASAMFSFKYRYLYLNEELPIQHEIAKDYFGQELPDLWKIENNADLFLINSYQALGNSRPVSPTTVYLGGIHAASKVNPLPNDIKNFMDDSFSGIIYVNLDSATLRAFIETERLEKLINILDSSSFDIVWNLNGLPFVINMTTRLYQSPFIPQEDVLAHPNVRLFITTGSQRDIEDAIHHTIPVLGLSFSSSLEHYLLQIEKYDVGLVSNFDLEPSDLLLSKVEEIGSDEKYKLKMRHLNQLILDAPQTPKSKAVWWIEYVIRHDGTQHLRNSCNKLSWFQYLLLDVFIAATTTTFLMIFAVITVIVKIKRYSKSLPVELITRRTKAKLL